MTHGNLGYDEANRLAALRQLLVLDSPYEAVFDSIVRLVANICGVPIALISLVDEERQWFKAQVGLDGVRETQREIAFCAHTILENEVMEVKDARKEARFCYNPLVTGEPHIVYYAGAPITMPMGEKIGTVSIIDTKPNEISDMQKQVLIGLADIVAKALTARRVSMKELSKDL